MNTTEVLPSQALYSATISSNILKPSDTCEGIDLKLPKNQDQPKKSSSKSKGKDDQAILIDSPSQAGSENLKSTSSSNKALTETQQDQLNNVTPPPELLFKKLEEKAILHDKKRELETNASTQINSVLQMIGVNNDMKNRNIKEMNELMLYQYANPSLGGAASDLFISNLYPTSYQNIIGNQNYINPANYYIQNLELASLANQLRPDINGQLFQQLGNNTEDVLRSLGYPIIEEKKGIKQKAMNDYQGNQSSDKKKNAHEEEDIMEMDPKGNKNAQTKRKKGRQCLNKLCNTDPNDPNLWCKQKIQNSLICKECFEAYRRNQFCCFCFQIYLENDSSNAQDDKDWIECEECKRWNHIDCEIENGNKTIRAQQEYKYYCPTCRDLKAQKGSAGKRGTRGLPPRTGYLQKTTSMQRQEPPVVKKQPPPKQIAHPKPQEDELPEDSFEEITKKLKPNEHILMQENIQNGLIITQNIPPETDVAKKKLDSMFLRHQNNQKKKFQTTRVVTFTHLDTYSDIEKLMTIYAGKHFIFTESEIKEHLAEFNSLLAKGPYYSDDKYFAGEDGFDYGDFNEEGGVSSKNSKGRGGAKNRGKGKSRGGKTNNVDFNTLKENDSEYDSDARSQDKKNSKSRKID